MKEILLMDESVERLDILRSKFGDLSYEELIETLLDSETKKLSEENYVKLNPDIIIALMELKDWFNSNDLNQTIANALYLISEEKFKDTIIKYFPELKSKQLYI